MHSQDDLEELYLKTLEYAKEIKRNTVLEKSEQALEHHNLNACSIITIMEHRSRVHSCLLKKVQCTPQTLVNLSCYDIVSSIYVPSYISTVTISFADTSVDYVVSKRPEKSLRDVLIESKALSFGLPLEKLLSESKDTRLGYRHRAGRKIVLKGVEYVRIEPCKPFLPSYAMLLTEKKLNVYEECDIYLEVIVLNADVRRELAWRDMVVQVNKELWRIEKGYIITPVANNVICNDRNTSIYNTIPFKKIPFDKRVVKNESYIETEFSTV